MMKKTAAVILAAGKGTRMKSHKAKVLHEICGIPMILFVVEAAFSVVEDVTVVVGHQGEAVKTALMSYKKGLRFAFQKEQLGTGHAVLTALPEVPQAFDTIAVLCGDTPLITSHTLKSLVETHQKGSHPMTILGTRLDNPYGYGRVVCQDGNDAVAIIEESDANDHQRHIKTINSGTYCINRTFLKSVLPEIECDNVQNEFYLTDVVACAYKRKDPALFIEAPDSVEVLGVNTSEDLALAEKIVANAIQEGCENPLDFCRFR